MRIATFSTQSQPKKSRDPNPSPPNTTRAPFDFPRVSGHLSRRGATNSNGRGQVLGGQVPQRRDEVGSPSHILITLQSSASLPRLSDGGPLSHILITLQRVLRSPASAGRRRKLSEPAETERRRVTFTHFNLSTLRSSSAKRLRSEVGHHSHSPA